jgi:hypothetical protein
MRQKNLLKTEKRLDGKITVVDLFSGGFVGLYFHPPL